MVRLQINSEPLNLECNSSDILIDLQVKVKEPIQNTFSPCLESGQSIVGTVSSDSSNITINNNTVYDSAVNGFDSWVDISAVIPGPITVENVNLFIDFTNVIDCCGYEIYIRGSEEGQITPNITCDEEEPNVIKIPKIGFGGGGYGKDMFGGELGDEEVDGIFRVVDNKKSWVYNPGKSNIGVKIYDTVTRDNGDEGLISGHGKINRQFAPSEDANLPYRYTDYRVQSSLSEKHSDLVINSKELGLVFNMRPTNTYCPNGYTLISGTTCSNGTTNKEAIPVTLINLEEYKKTFQSFWLKMTEQFVPATAIFTSAEKWSNNIDDICEEITETDMETDLTDEDLSASVNNELVISSPSPPTVVFLVDAPVLEIQTLENPSDEPLQLSSNTLSSGDNDIIKFDSLTVSSLEKNLNEVTTSEKLKIDNLVKEKEKIKLYYDSFNNKQTINQFL